MFLVFTQQRTLADPTAICDVILFGVALWWFSEYLHILRTNLVVGHTSMSIRFVCCRGRIRNVETRTHSYYESLESLDCKM